MLNEQGFDLWADGYDRSVGLSDEENRYPFAGYREVLNRIAATVLKTPNAVVLDLGFGTGVLTATLYEHGCTIFGQDFSERMIESAQEKMPNAKLFRGDFSQGLAAPLLMQRYDCIVSTYALHHLGDEQKVPFLNMLRTLLKPGGNILIGDVAFATRADWEACRRQAGDEWDDEEFYFVADELQEAFPYLTFTPISFCAGVFTLSR